MLSGVLVPLDIIDSRLGGLEPKVGEAALEPCPSNPNTEGGLSGASLWLPFDSCLDSLFPEGALKDDGPDVGALKEDGGPPS